MQSVPTRISARSITSLPDLLTSLSALESLESSLSTSLSTLLADSQPIASSLARLQQVAPRIEELHGDARLLSEKVGTTAQTAERVGGKVKALDEEMRRVREATERVGIVMELKASLTALYASIDSQDWESAARHCARAMSIPSEVISGPFAESTVPTADLPLPPSQTLAEARLRLLDVFKLQFDRASKSRDSSATTRFFKLFPTIGWELEGLEAYANFVVDLVRGRAPVAGKTSSPLYFIATLTSLFENIALIVDQHQPIVEKYYGVGKMLPVVQRLLGECDRVVGTLIEGWEEDRGMKRKLQDVANPTFHTLGPNSSRKAGTEEDDSPDPREIDKVLSEIAGMAGRWGLFRRFLWERLKEDHSENGDIPKSASSEGTVPPEQQVLETCACRFLFEHVLETYYIPLETWYLRTIVDKAHRLSATDPSTLPLQTTTPDDVFYILKVVLTRLLSTGYAAIIDKMIGSVKEVLERDFAGFIQKKLEEVYSGKNTNASKSEKAEKENRNTFITHLNDLDISCSHLDTLVKTVITSSTLSQNFLDFEAEVVRTSLSSLISLLGEFRSILKAGVDQLFNQLTRPRLRLLIAEMYKDISYILEEDSFSVAEYQDLVRKRFIKHWELLVDGFKDTFTENNYNLFFSLAVDVLVRPWEKQIMGMKFTEMGAIRFDRDLRSISTYLASQTAFGNPRDKFQRLQQISTLLNLDLEEDPDEFYMGSGIVWRLNANEAKAVLSLRV